MIAGRRLLENRRRLLEQGGVDESRAAFIRAGRRLSEQGGVY